MMSNTRGSILIPTLVAVAIVAAIGAGVVFLNVYSSMLAQRRQALVEVDYVSHYLWNVLQQNNTATGGTVCDSALNAVVWSNPNAPAAVNQLQIYSSGTSTTTTWKAGTQVSPHLTLAKMDLRQPTGVSPEPAKDSMSVNRNGVTYTSYLAKLELSFSSTVFGGAPAPGGIYLNVQVDSSGHVAYCYPATELQNQLSYENEMNQLCSQSPYVNPANCGYRDSSGNPVVNPSWFGAPSAGATGTPPTAPAFNTANQPYVQYNLVGFDVHGTPICNTTCVIPNSVTIGSRYTGGCATVGVKNPVTECPSTTTTYYPPGTYPSF